MYECSDVEAEEKLIKAGKDLVEDEDALMKELEDLLVKKTNQMVKRIKFREMKQQKLEDIKEMLIKLKSIAKGCDFTVECECKKRVDYSDKEILDQLVVGMKDKEHQERVLTHEKLDLEKTVSLIESLEAGKRSKRELEESSDLNSLKGESSKAKPNKQDGRLEKKNFSTEITIPNPDDTQSKIDLEELKTDEKTLGVWDNPLGGNEGHFTVIHDKMEKWI